MDNKFLRPSSLTKKEEVIELGTLVKSKKTGEILGHIGFEDSEDCDLNESGEFENLNYFVVPVGKEWDDYVIYQHDDLEITVEK